MTEEEHKQFAPLEEVFEAIKAERQHQDDKWGVQAHPINPMWSAILSEEVGEASQALLGAIYHPNSLTRSHLFEELIQVAAVATAWAQKVRANQVKEGDLHYATK